MGRTVKLNKQYPFFSRPIHLEPLRKSVWKVINEPYKPTGECLRLHMSPQESYGLCYGFIFDGFSIPWYGRWLIEKDQPGLIVAAFHDSWCEKQYIPHKLAHRNFKKCLKAYTLRGNEFIQEFNYSRFDRWGMGNAVVIGGPRWKELKDRPAWA